MLVLQCIFLMLLDFQSYTFSLQLCASDVVYAVNSLLEAPVWLKSMQLWLFSFLVRYLTHFNTTRHKQIRSYNERKCYFFYWHRLREWQNGTISWRHLMLCQGKPGKLSPDTRISLQLIIMRSVKMPDFSALLECWRLFRWFLKT